MLERIFDDMAKFVHLNTNLILVEYSKVEAVRLCGELSCLVLFHYKPNIVPHSHVFNGIAVRSLVYQLVEVLFNLVSFALPPLLFVIFDVRLKVGKGRKADGAVHLNELHPTVKVKSEEITVYDVF